MEGWLEKLNIGDLRPRYAPLALARSAPLLPDPKRLPVLSSPARQIQALLLQDSERRHGDH